MNKTHITVYSQRLFDIIDCVSPHCTIHFILHSSHLLAFQDCWRKVTKPLSRFHSSVINANVSILRLVVGYMAGWRVCFMREFMKMFAAGSGGGEGRSEDPWRCPRIFVSCPPHCTGDAPSGTTPLRACARVCVYVAARYYRIILGYFTGT